MIWWSSKRLFAILSATVVAVILGLSYFQPRYDFTMKHYFGGMNMRNNVEYYQSGTPNKFYPINETGMFTFQDVCIEDLDVPQYIEYNHMGWMKYNLTKKIVIYNSINQSRDHVLNIVAGPDWDKEWIVNFEKSPVPRSNRFVNYNAYFVTSYCMGSIFHYWRDEHLLLCKAINKTGQLMPGAGNQVIYKRPFHSSPIYVQGYYNCNNKGTFEHLLFSLYTQKIHAAFFQLPSGICFKNAVFGLGRQRADYRATADQVLRYYNMSDLTNEDKYVTIVQRLTRRIINAESLAKAARDAGYKNVRITIFEDNSSFEQIQMAATTRIMIGVHGAGLQWAMLMTAGLHLIEIAWPTKYWPFHYSDSEAPQYGLKAHKLEATDARLNWTSYETMLAVNTSEATRKWLIERHKFTGLENANNIWQWADVFVNETELLKILVKNGTLL